MKKESPVRALSTVFQLAEQIAHDLRSPLTALNLTLSHLHELEERDLHLLGGAVERIKNIADDLQRLSRTDPDRGALIPTENLACLATRVYLPRNGHVVVLDDDACFHDVWKHRFSLSDMAATQVHHLFSPAEFRRWREQHETELFRTLFLLDYDLKETTTGLTLADEGDPLRHFILVTSHYESQHVLIRCTQQNIKVLPKEWVEFIPLEYFSP